MIEGSLTVTNSNKDKTRPKSLIKFGNVGSHKQLSVLGRGRFKHCSDPGYLLLQLSNCMLLAGVRVHEHW